MAGHPVATADREDSPAGDMIADFPRASHVDAVRVRPWAVIG